jgi:hypothetical protein
MGILAFILVKLKGGKAQIPGLPLLKLPKIGNNSSQQIRIVERTLLEGRKKPVFDTGFRRPILVDRYDRYPDYQFGGRSSPLTRWVMAQSQIIPKPLQNMWKIMKQKQLIKTLGIASLAVLALILLFLYFARAGPEWTLAHKTSHASQSK